MIAASFLPMPSATAIHGLSDNHVSDQDIDYKLHMGSLNLDQRTAIVAAADEWKSEMGKSQGGLDLNRGPSYFGSSPQTYWDDAGVRLVWEGEAPGGWPSGCGNAIACVRAIWNEVSGGDDHIVDVDGYFDEDITWPSDGSECSNPDAIDVSDGRADQFTVALHEWGHWWHLKDAGSSGSLMTETDTQCWRDISSHDRATAYDVYDFITNPGHTHVSH